jgi:anti-sigma factor RsiW
MAYCRTLTELITDYLEGKLSVAERVKFEIHLGMCRHCRAYLHQMRQTLAVLGELPEAPMPADVKAELMKRFRGWTAER